MSFVFDIAEAPPERIDIAEKREQAVSERAVFRKRNIRFMIGMATVTAVYVAFVLIFIWPMLEKPQTGIIFYFFPYVTFLIFIVGNELHIKRIEKPSKKLDETIEELSEVPDDELSDAFNGKEHASEVLSYMESVAAQGRALVRAELEAIQQWYESNNPEK